MMRDGSDEVNEANFEVFREVFFSVLSAASGKPDRGSKASTKRRHVVGAKSTRQGGGGGATAAATTSSKIIVDDHKTTITDDPSELVDFSDYVAREVFDSLPENLSGLSHSKVQDDLQLAERWSLPLTLGTIEEVSSQISPTVTDSLVAYGLVDPPRTDLHTFISPIISGFISAATTPPPKWIATRSTACEICERDWVPLTYHHLIPRGVHAKVMKRGWHDEAMLNSVAWLCRACHTFVHRMASNEELARDWYTVDRICTREDVQKWAHWVGKVRWKKR